MLDFVQNHFQRQIRDKTQRISLGGTPHNIIVEAKIRIASLIPDHSCQGCLPTLTRAVDQNNRTISECVKQAGFGKSMVQRA
jgi:hypothetical protein